VLLHDVVVVEQPLAGGADVGAPIGSRGEARVRVLEDATGAVEAGEEWGAPAGAPGDEALPDGQILRAFTQALGAQQLAADRARQEVFAGGRTAREQAGEPAGRLQRRNGEGLGRWERGSGREREIRQYRAARRALGGGKAARVLPGWRRTGYYSVGSDPRHPLLPIAALLAGNREGRRMSSHIARIERSNRRGLDHLEVELTVTESTGGHQNWSGEFSSPSADGILPDERLSLTLETGQKGMVRVKETRFDSRHPEATRIHFTGIGPLA
jgi:hypothetical protein